MMLARWERMVFTLVLRSPAICLLELPSDLSARDRLDRKFELARRRVLVDIARGAGAQSFEDVPVACVHGKNDHAHIWIFLHDPARRFQPPEARHEEVHEHQPRLMFGDHIDGLATVTCLADDLGPAESDEQRPETRTHEQMMVGENDPDRCHVVNAGR